MIWYSKPFAAWVGGIDIDISSDTLYLTPLFAPGVTFHSHVSSKSPNVAAVMRSPPFIGRPSAARGTLPLATFLIAPARTTQCPGGTLSEPTPRQPANVRPSNSSRHPAERSAGVRSFGLFGTGAGVVCSARNRNGPIMWAPPTAPARVEALVCE